MKTTFLLFTLGFALPAETGEPAAEIPIQTVEGGEISLAHYKGKVTLIEFILTSCSHCQACSRELQAVNAEYAPRGVQIAPVAINDMAHMFIPDFVKAQGVKFPVGYVHRDTAAMFLKISPDGQ